MSGGEWRMLGQLVATQVVVESAATLGGTGTVHGVAVVRGVVAPGLTATDVGTLNFADDVAFDGGCFACDVAASNSLDRLAVAGAISGVATVLVVQAAGVYPDQEVIATGNAASAYGSFAVSPEAGWKLGTSGALDLWLGVEPSMAFLGTNGAAVASGDPASRDKGTKFPPILPGTAVTNVLSITNDGNAVLEIGDFQTNGADRIYFTIAGLPNSIPIGGSSPLTVTYAPVAPARHAVSLVISNNSPTNPYTVNLAGSCYALSTNNGPHAGGNAVTLTNGHYGTITNVRVGGVAAAIQASGANWVAFTVPEVGSSGLMDLLVQTSDNGDHEIPGAYVVNPAGSIADVLPANGSWTGGYSVAIGGADLGNGGDVTHVTLCGVAAAIDSQSATQVVVTAGIAGTVGLGDVQVYSTSHGETVAGDAFEYLREFQSALVFSPASPQSYGTTNPLAVLGGSGTGAVAYAVVSGPGAIVGETNLAVTAGSGTITVAATKAQDALHFAASATALVAAAKAEQIIVDFQPADGMPFLPGATTSVNAQASSGLAVAFENLTPDIASLVGTDIAFTNPGLARVRAMQAGDANWNATAVVHSWRISGWITNVAPGTANVGGGIEVVIQGIALGDGVDVTNVTLCGVEATILTQSVQEVSVLAGGAPAAATGDVAVTSATGGFMVLSNAFEYLWLDPPDQLDPADIRTTSFLARWRTVPAAATHLLDVGMDTNFSAYLPGYSARDVGTATTHRVAGLALGAGYATRLFAWNEAGLSWPSRTVWTDLALATPGDFDGDGVADPLVFMPTTGAWDMDSSTGTAAWLTPWGGRSMLPVPADYDGDGTDDFALYQRSTGIWFLLYSSGGSARIEFGGTERIPLPGDYDGDGRADLATYSAADARWAFQATTAGPYELAFGGRSMVPVPADYDGDGAIDVAVYRPSTGVWYILYSGGGARVAQLGWATTVPVPADYDGDGRADLAVLNRPTSNWCIQYSGGGSLVVPFGYKTMTPVPADYDGDGLADIAMYHAASGTWYVRDSFTGAQRSFPLGGPDQIPAHRIPLLHSWYGLPWTP